MRRNCGGRNGGEFDGKKLSVCKKFSNDKMGEEKKRQEVVKEMCWEGISGSWRESWGELDQDLFYLYMIFSFLLFKTILTLNIF